MEKPSFPLECNRREFFRWAAGGLGVLQGEISGSGPEILDTHLHLWSFGWGARFLGFRREPSPPWLRGAPERLRHNFGLQEYREAVRGFSVQALYMEVDVAEKDLDLEMASVRRVSEGSGGQVLGAVLGGRPDAPGFAEWVRRCREWQGTKGVRRVLHSGTTPRGLCVEPAFVEGVRQLGRAGLTFDVCIRPGELGDAVRLAKACPDTVLVLDHCGNGDAKAFQKKPVDQPAHTASEWQRGIEQLARCRNVVCKISGVIESLPKGWAAEDLAPVVNHCLDAFGPDRVVFGTNWPVCLVGGTARAWIHALGEIVASRPEAVRKKLWSGNACQIYRLS